MSLMTGGGPPRTGYRARVRTSMSGARASSGRRGWLVPLIVALTLLPEAIFAQPYRWVDEQGGIHITDDLNSIPERHRPQLKENAPPTESPAATPSPGAGPSGSAGSGQSNAPGQGGVALWLQVGGLRGTEEPVLIQVYDSQDTCAAERDRRTEVHVRQGMQRTNQPGLAISNMGGTVVGSSFFAYKCLPAEVRFR